MSCGAPVTTPQLLQGPCLQPHLTPEIPPQHELGPASQKHHGDSWVHPSTGCFQSCLLLAAILGDIKEVLSPFLPFIRRLVRSMCWSWRVNKHQSALAKRRMLSAKFNFGKTDPVAPALLVLHAGGWWVQEAASGLSPPPARPTQQSSRGS